MAMKVFYPEMRIFLVEQGLIRHSPAGYGGTSKKTRGPSGRSLKREDRRTPLSGKRAISGRTLSNAAAASTPL